MLFIVAHALPSFFCKAEEYQNSSVVTKLKFGWLMLSYECQLTSEGILKNIIQVNTVYYTTHPNTHRPPPLFYIFLETLLQENLFISTTVAPFFAPLQLNKTTQQNLINDKKKKRNSLPLILYPYPNQINSYSLQSDFTVKFISPFLNDERKKGTECSLSP